MNTSDLEAQIRAIRERHAAATRARVRAEHEKDAAQAQADKSREQLQREFGVTTMPEARDMLDKLEGELAEALNSVRAALDEIGV